MHIVAISWPDDPDRTVEVYGPFENPVAQLKWVEDCQKAADRGWAGLKGATYIVDRLNWPFDPTELAKRPPVPDLKDWIDIEAAKVAKR